MYQIIAIRCSCYIKVTYIATDVVILDNQVN